MPELPDVESYCHALRSRLLGQRLEAIRLAGPFLLRTATPPVNAALGRTVTAIRRIGKRIVLQLEPDFFLVFHLMIAGRFRWGKPGAPVPGKIGLAALDFPSGTLLITEAGSKKRASLHLVHGEDALSALNPGGLEVLQTSLSEFKERLRKENHTLKRALTDPHLFSGIGNAYSDEILHAARMSPFRRTQQLSEAQIEVLFQACRDVLTSWSQRLQEEIGDGFPAKVTAFREGMAVHGRYRQPCPVCNSSIQRVVYAGSEANYCAKCQTEGRVLTDRALSQLLREDWPRTLEELEVLRSRKM